MFNFDSIDNFDKHISSSIRGYDILHDLIVNLSSFFIKNLPPLDLGCTSGKLINEVSRLYNVQGIGYDITDVNFISGDAVLRKIDITKDDFIMPCTNLIYSVFTLQFLGHNERVKVLKKCYEALGCRGTLIICEKEIIKNELNEVFTFSNYDYKLQNFSIDEIFTKERDLRKIMTPYTYQENMIMLKGAGFTEITQFFQSLQFKGYICQK